MTVFRHPWIWGVLLGIALLAAAQWGFPIRSNWDAVVSSMVAVLGILVFMFSLVGWVYMALRRAFLRKEIDRESDPR